MDEYKVWAEEILVKVKEKMEWVSEKNKEKIPYTTDENGNYDDRSNSGKNWNLDDGLNWWTNGFGGVSRSGNGFHTGLCQSKEMKSPSNHQINFLQKY